MGQPPPNAYPPGTVLTVGSHKARIVKYISAGGFAQVYLVQISPFKDGSDIACLKRVLVPNKATLNILRAEVDAMKRLKGKPYIVSYIDSHAARSPKNDGTYEVFLLMEYCSKNGLIDFLNSRLQNRLSEDEVLEIMYQVSIGLAQVHFLNPPLIHRDIKIENILINDQNEYRLCDFGSSCPPLRPPRNQQEFRILQDDILRYTTAQYRAPEMIDLSRNLPIDEKSDIWALGVFCYKICYYTTPFEHTGEPAILQSKFVFPSYPVYSPQMQNLIRVLLTNDARLRPNIYQVIEEVCRLKHVPVPMDVQQQYATYKQQKQMLLQQIMNPAPAQAPSVTGPGANTVPNMHQITQNQAHSSSQPSLAASHVIKPQQPVSSHSMPPSQLFTPSTTPKSLTQSDVVPVSNQVYNDAFSKSTTSVKSGNSAKSAVSAVSGRSSGSAISVVSYKDEDPFNKLKLEYAKRNEKAKQEKPESQEKTEKPDKIEKPERPERPERPEKGSKPQVTPFKVYDDTKPSSKSNELNLQVIDVDLKRLSINNRSASANSGHSGNSGNSGLSGGSSSAGNGSSRNASKESVMKLSAKPTGEKYPFEYKMPKSDIKRSQSFHKRTLSVGKTGLNRLTNSFTGKFKPSSRTPSRNSSSEHVASNKSEDELLNEIAMKEFKDVDYLKPKSNLVQKRMNLLLTNKEEIVKTATGYGKYTENEQPAPITSASARSSPKPSPGASFVESFSRKSFDAERSLGKRSSSGLKFFSSSSEPKPKPKPNTNPKPNPKPTPKPTPKPKPKPKPPVKSKPVAKKPPPIPKKPTHLKSPKVDSDKPENRVENAFFEDDLAAESSEQKGTENTDFVKNDFDDDSVNDDEDFDVNDFEKSFYEKFPTLS